MASSAVNPDLRVARLCFGEFELDEADARLTRDGEP